MRFAYELPPWKAADNTPAVSAVSGLGTGGGASVQTPDSGGFGDVFVYPAPNFSSSGSVALTFPSTPPTLFISAAEGFGTVTQETTSDVITISWTGATFPAASRTKKFQIHYEWANSNSAN